MSYMKRYLEQEAEIIAKATNIDEYDIMELMTKYNTTGTGTDIIALVKVLAIQEDYDFTELMNILVDMKYNYEKGYYDMTWPEVVQEFTDITMEHDW